MFWLLYEQQQNKAIFGVIGCGLMAGWLLGHWDEIKWLVNYQFVEVMLLPIVVVLLLIVVGVMGYGIRKTKHF